MYSRLSIMMFLQYAVMGAVMPIMGLYLKSGLGFSPVQVGVVLAMPAVGALVAPVFAMRIADRLLSAERTLAVSHFLCGVLMLVLSYQTDYRAVVAVYLAYALAMAPTMGLTNAIAFHHLPNAGGDFGRVRVWGTVGWIAIAWVFAVLYVAPAAGAPPVGLSMALTVSAGASFVLAAFAVRIPAAHDRPAAGTRLFHAAGLLLQRNILVLCIVTFLMAILNQFYMQWMGPYMSQIGFDDGAILPVLSLGQVFEIAAIAYLGWFLGKAGMKWMLMLGMALQLVRFLVFALAPTTAAVLPAVCLHGVSFAFYGVTAYIYLDRLCTPAERAGVQQLYGIASAGIGALLGSVLAGYTGQWLLAEDGDINFRLFWLVPAAISAFACAFLMLAFRPEADD